ncbi:GH22623 [Drosophila grimshawi]|uniref:GH22623 n=1 Tax=Drosophila grimshawi TaxID=7222 RepID=B4JVQ3_DROGR|nr:GH22623 [Drosophila grimshawi]
MDNSVISDIDELGDTTPIPELTFFDLLEPTETSRDQHMNAAESDGDGAEDDENKTSSSASANALLNTPGSKKVPIVRILENKRLTAPSPMGTPLKNMLGGHVRVVTPTKSTKPTDVKIVNQLQANPLKAIANSAVKIGSTTIAAPTGSGSISAQPSSMQKNMSSVTMTQLKTAGGQVLFIQKSLSSMSGAISKVSQSSTGAAIRQAIISKGVTLSGTGTGQIKSIAYTAPVTVRGLTTTGTPKPTPQSSTNIITSTTDNQSQALVRNPPSVEVASESVTVSAKMPIQVRTADGKLVKLNQGTPLLLNSKPTTVAVKPSITTSLASTNNSNKLITKSAAQVIIKGPLKTLTASASERPAINNISSSISNTTTSGSSSAASLPTAPTTIPTGKMLVQSSTGKQIVVASKNIIKLSPKTGASALTKTNAIGTASGLHTIQVQGKSGVQYVRVLPNNNNEIIASSRNSNTSISVPVSNTSKIVMKTMGSIVPLPSMQTLVPRRAPGTVFNAVQAKTPITNSSSLEVARKNRLSDINVQIKHLAIDNSSDAGGPEAKKAHYLIAMPQTKSAAMPANPTATKHMLIEARPSQMQRVSVQGTNKTVSSISSNTTHKVYNLVTKSDANGVKYMICNKGGEGKPRTVFNTTMRRGYTLADTKLRRPITLTAQQLRMRQMKLQQQRQVIAQAKLRQEQLQKRQQHSSQTKSPQQKLPILQSSSTQDNKLCVPAKPLFDILKPAPMPTPSPAASASLDVLGGSRRKHCNCSKSQCLKLYCDCFANGEFCQDCTCKDCFNNLDYEVKRERAIPWSVIPAHLRCRNMEDRPDVDMDSIDNFADVANKRKELNGTYLQDNRSNVYLTDDVIEATIMCMISRIVMHEKQRMCKDSTEREVMEELGESLNQIITFAKEKNDTLHMDDPKTTA